MDWVSRSFTFGMMFFRTGPKAQHSQIRVQVKDAQLDDQLLGSSFPVLAKRSIKPKEKHSRDKLFSFSLVREKGLHRGRIRYVSKRFLLL